MPRFSLVININPNQPAIMLSATPYLGASHSRLLPIPVLRSPPWLLVYATSSLLQALISNLLFKTERYQSRPRASNQHEVLLILKVHRRQWCYLKFEEEDDEKFKKPQSWHGKHAPRGVLAEGLFKHCQNSS